MATDKKEADKKTEEVKPKESIAQQLNAIAAKNSQIIAVRNMQEGKEKLKDKVGRKNPSTQNKIQGLQGLASLKNTLGTQGQ
jgi:hypothetical protein